MSNSKNKKIRPAVYKKSWGNSIFDAALWLPVPLAVMSVAKVIYQRHFNNIASLNRFLKNFKFVNLAFAITSSLLISLKILQIIVQKAVSVGMLPSTVMSKSMFYHNMPSENNLPENIKVIKVRTHDGIELDTLEVTNSSSVKKLIDQQRVIINFCPNAMVYQQAYNSQGMQDLAQKMQMDKAVYFNYRGVDANKADNLVDQNSSLQLFKYIISQIKHVFSKNPNSYIDLVNDGIAQVEHLRGQGIEYKNIHLYGHSMGGGIATKVAMHYQEQGIQLGSLLADRTYGDIVHTAEDVVEKVWKKAVLLTRSIVSNAGWDINISDDFIGLKIKKLCIALGSDEVIGKGCLNQAIQKEDKQAIVVNLNEGHCYPISSLLSDECMQNGQKVKLSDALDKHFSPVI